MSTNISSDFTVVLAYYGIAISIQRALFTCAGGTSYYDLDREKLLFQDIFSVLNSLLEKELVGVWLSCMVFFLPFYNACEYNVGLT